jgi:hypothetical protein
MADYLKETYRAVVQVDNYLHGVRDQLRTRLHAMGLGTDPTFLESVEAAQENADSGKAVEDSFSASDL